MPDILDATAESRLAESGRLFTSDLSVPEFALLEHTGFVPIEFVMGVSVYHIGFQPPRGLAAGEYTVLTQAMYAARENALARLVAETAKVGGDGVVGVRLGYRRHGEDSLEFSAIGTAIRRADGQTGYRRPDGQPFTSHLGAKEFYQLLNVGWYPVAFVLGTCVYHVAVQGLVQTMRQIGQNAELPQWTQGFYDARELAMSRLQGEAERAGATGVVGVTAATSEWVWGGHTLEFFVSGTGVRKISDKVGQLPPLVVTS
ncbi:MAG: heavy metal-binding domain-containing protein [Mycobacteriales bacterium]